MSSPRASVAPTTVVIWCSAGNKIGRGHLSRCLTLADALIAHDAEVTFVPGPLDPASQAWVTRRGHRLAAALALGDRSAALHPAAWTGVLRADWVIIDSYRATSAQIASCAEQTQVLVIDDLNDRDLSAANIIVNPTPGSEHWSYRFTDRTRLLAGPSFALVHGEFQQRRQRARFDRKFPGTADRIAVALGGTDSEARTGALTSHLMSWPGATVRVAGEGVDVQSPSVERLGFVDPEALADLMEWCDLFIATPSSLTWELATLGVPAAFLQTVPNQDHIARFLSDSAGLLVAGMGWHLGEALDELRRSAAARRSAAEALGGLCDGLGAERVASSVLRS